MTSPVWLLAKLGYRCNNRCLFCHAAPHEGFDLTTAQALERIERAARLGAGGLILSGGEPTIRRDLPRLLATFPRLGLRLGLVTNGRTLAYQKVRHLLLASGLDYIQVSLAAGSPDAADALTQVPGSFEQARTGLAALAAQAPPTLRLTVSCVLTRPALETLDSLASLALDTAGARPDARSRPRPDSAPGRDIPTPPRLRLKLAALEPEGRALDYWSEIGVSLSEVASAVRAFADRWSETLAAAGVQLCEEALPPCLDHHVPVRADLFSDRILGMAEAFEPDYVPTDDGNKARAAICLDCSRDDCPGPYATQLERTGPDGLAPLRQRRPPGLLLLPEADLGRGSCPVRRGLLGPPLPGDQLLTVRGGHWRLWRIAGEDFGLRARLHVLRDLEQVYLRIPSGPERTGPAHPFHAAVKLRRSRRCAGCPLHLVCGGAFVTSRPDPVAADELLLDSLVAGLSGRVLDVGSGVPSYLQALHGAAWAGRITAYLGVDPDPPSEAALQSLLHPPVHTSPSRPAPTPTGSAPPTYAGPSHPAQSHSTAPSSGPIHPSIRFTQGRAEDLDVEGPWDWVLSIRALAHYESPTRFLAQVARLLAPGGRLLLISDSAFALLTETEPPPASPDDWPHLRNPWPWDLEPLLPPELRVEWTRPASPETSNLTFLVARRVSG